MTMYRCWISFDTDRALQSRIKQGHFGDKDNLNIPIDNFPAPPSAHYCWTGTVCGWCRENNIKFVNEGLFVHAKVKKKQIEDFIEYVYGGDPSYFQPAKMLTWQGHAYLANSLNDLRSFVAQELSPRLWYQLNADEF